MLSQDIAAAEMSQDVEQIDVLIGVIPAFSELPASVRDHLLAPRQGMKKSLPERQDEDLSLSESAGQRQSRRTAGHDRKRTAGRRRLVQANG